MLTLYYNFTQSFLFTNNIRLNLEGSQNSDSGDDETVEEQDEGGESKMKEKVISIIAIYCSSTCGL